MVNEGLLSNIYEILDRAAEKRMKTPHKPTLIPLKEIDDKLYLCNNIKGEFVSTDRIVKAKYISDFSFTEEEVYFPLQRKCEEKGLELSLVEIDTKILKSMYSDLDFDAYTYEVNTIGLDLDGFKHIEGKLYKIIEK